MKKNNYKAYLRKVAYSESKTYHGGGHISEYGIWMSEAENASYYKSYCSEIYRDLNRRASSMRI